MELVGEVISLGYICIYKLKIRHMTQEQFNEWEIDLACSLFHVTEDVIDDRYGVRKDQVIVLEYITSNPEVLKFMDLKQILELNQVI